jgi:NADPH:quinone reductase-like Zn-dependent oxidoreductase
LADIGEVDVVFDVIGGEILLRSAALVRSGGALVSIAEPPPIQPGNGRAIFFVVEPDRAGLAELECRLEDGRLRPLVGEIYPLAEAPVAFEPDRRSRGKSIIRVVDDARIAHA